jgi:hypothetical protein
VATADERAEQARAEQIWAELGRVGFVLLGSIVSPQTPARTLAGAPRAGARALPHLDPPSRGTVTRTLMAEQAERYRPFFGNARRLRALVSELKQVSARFWTSGPRNRQGGRSFLPAADP